MSREHRIPIMFSADELAAIDEHRFTNRIASRAAAVRSLCLDAMAKDESPALAAMLDALHDAADRLAENVEDDPEATMHVATLAKVRAAIAKAEGR